MVVTLTAIPDVPMVRPGDDLAAVLIGSCEQNALAPVDGDVLVVAQKIVSKAEGRYADLATVRPSERALRLAAEVHKDARLSSKSFWESRARCAARPGVLIVEHRLASFWQMRALTARISTRKQDRAPSSYCLMTLMARRPICASASHVTSTDTCCHHHRQLGRAGDGAPSALPRCGGPPAVMDLRGRPDLFGHELRVTQTGFADEVACAASSSWGRRVKGGRRCWCAALHGTGILSRCRSDPLARRGPVR
jgi:coenzyme F420-0:L-glutamate ligase/coenzyme F420-1:gamma-L-glutamate ligase